jgi:hypothetical protein
VKKLICPNWLVCRIKPNGWRMWVNWELKGCPHAFLHTEDEVMELGGRWMCTRTHCQFHHVKCEEVKEDGSRG